jgi:hypothetical protein
MDRFNEASLSRNGRCFFSRGTHGKVCFPWAAPQLLDKVGSPEHLLNAEISGGVVRDLRYHIGKQVEAEWRAKLSDSSGASRTEVGLPPPNIDARGMPTPLFMSSTWL